MSKSVLHDKGIIQLIKFGIVGISNTLVALVVYYALVWLNCNYLVANFWAWIISVYNAFFWNNRYVLKNNARWWIALSKTYISYGVSFLLGMCLLYLLVEYAGCSELVAPVITLLVTILMNFILNKFWTFKSR